MDLLSKVILGMALIIIGAVIIFTLATHAANAKRLTAGQASTFIYNYLKQSSPNASVEIINVSPSRLVNGSWDVFVGVVYNQTRACPTITIEDFDYPATSMLPRTDNVYASNCTVYGNSSIETARLPAIAIATAYQESGAAQAYVRKYGYNNTYVHAEFFSELNNSPYNPSNENRVWVVNYSATSANYSLYLTLNTSGTVINSVK